MSNKEILMMYIFDYTFERQSGSGYIPQLSHFTFKRMFEYSGLGSYAFCSKILKRMANEGILVKSTGAYWCLNPQYYDQRIVLFLTKFSKV